MAEVASAFVSLMPSAKGFGTATERAVKPQMDRAGKNIGGIFGKALKASALAVTGGAVVAAGFLKGSIEEAREAQKVGALTNSVIKATGGAANVTAKQVGDLAGALSAKTGIDDEVIQSGQNMLLTFKNIRNEAGKGNDIFDQTSKTLIDMSAAMGTEPKQAAIQLGKALNDPIKGVAALGRVGVTFTEQQKEQIKTLVESGKTMDAQKIVLKELNSEFGGAAEAQATAGDKMKVAFGNLQEQVGTALLPVIDKVANIVTTKVIPAVSGFVEGIQDGTGAGGQFADAALRVKDAFVKVAPAVIGVVGFLVDNKEAVAAFIGVLAGFAILAKIRTMVLAVNAALAANPLTIVVVAVAALAAGLVYAYKKSETFRNIVNAVFKAVGKAVSFMWDNVIKPVFKLWLNMWFTVVGALLDGAAKAFGWVPKLGPKLKSVAGDFKDFREDVNRQLNGVKKNVTIDANTEPARRKIKSLTDYMKFALPLAGSFSVAPRTSLGSATSLFPARASGGPVSAGTTYLVGENGPELFTASQAGRIIPNNRLGAGEAGSMGPRTVIVKVPGYQFTGMIEDIADDVFSGRAALSSEAERALG